MCTRCSSPKPHTDTGGASYAAFRAAQGEHRVCCLARHATATSTPVAVAPARRLRNGSWQPQRYQSAIAHQEPRDNMAMTRRTTPTLRATRATLIERHPDPGQETSPVEHWPHEERAAPRRP